MNIKNRVLGEVYFTTDTVIDLVDIFTKARYRYVVLATHCKEYLALHSAEFLRNVMPDLIKKNF